MSVISRFDRIEGHTWRFIGLDGPSSDASNPRRATIKLYENGHRLGPANSDHATIALLGRGSFSFWKGTLLFATSDNSDPNTNGRQYDVVVEGRVVPLHPCARPAVGRPVGCDPFVRNSKGDPVIAVPKSALEGERIEALHQIAMLSRPGLRHLREIATGTTGAIVEIGAHVGGSTCAIADAIRGRGRAMVSIEVGIPSENSVSLGQSDIHADLRTNLAAWELDSEVHVIEDWLHRATLRIGKRLGVQKVGLLFIDADGRIAEHMFHMVPFLADGCVIVLDDFLDDVKGAGVASWVQAAITARAIEPMAVVDGGLWFGRLTAPPDRLPASPFIHEQGHCWLSTAVAARVAEGTVGSSSLRILEDGRDLIMGNANHDVIRRDGRGRFSLWGDFLYFASSDNSDPSTNGRRYDAVIHGEIVPMNYWCGYS